MRHLSPFRRVRLLLSTAITLLLTALLAHAWQQQPPADRSMADMPGMAPPAAPAAGAANHPCDDMHAMHGMTVMGESMAAMHDHMCITPLRARQPGDEEKARAVIAQVKASIEKYKDYKKALADGYVIANPTVVQPQAHFNNDGNIRLADTQFDPTRPSSLLYFRTPTQRYNLEGVMYTDSNSATEDELNERIPLSIARWHQHTNFCGAPADKVKQYHGDHPKFGMFGSIHTEEACRAEGGTFIPVMFSWMVHVFPYEKDLNDVFSLNDDAPHMH